MPASIRRQAKAINFGVIYGISAFGLANNLRIPREDAKRFIDTYFERFPGIREYMNRTIAFGKEHGHVETLFGRRIHTPEINARGPHAAPAQRQAINAPIQGSAADIIRRAMIRVPDAIRGLPARMLLQVHDELLFEVAEDAADETAARVRAVMAEAALPAVDLSVPLVVDAGSGADLGRGPLGCERPPDCSLSARGGRRAASKRGAAALPQPASRLGIGDQRCEAGRPRMASGTRIMARRSAAAEPIAWRWAGAACGPRR